MHIIRLLGGISIEGSQGLLTGRAVQRGRIALLSCLALSPTRSASRERLMALLWPDADGDRSRHLLRDAVYRLRETLGADAVRKTGDDLRLDAKCVRVDVWEFEEAVARNDLETSVRLYAGDLLDAYSLGDSVELEWWIDGERARLRELFARALEGVAEQRGRISRDLVGALSAWKRLAAIDPHNSRVALRLMEALEVAGDRAGALRHAAKHTALLESDLGAAPDPNVSAFAVKLRVHPEPRSHIAVPPSKPADAPSADAGSSAFATGDAPSRGRLSRKVMPWSALGALCLAAAILLWGNHASATEATLSVTRTTRLTADDGLEIQPSLSPDGKLIAYAAGQPGQTRIFVRPVSGGHSTPVTENAVTFAFQPRWSPDGSRLLYLTANGVYVAPILGGKVERVVAADDTNPVAGSAVVSLPILGAAWAPDGHRLFVARRGSVSVVDLEHTGERQLARDSYELHSCDWSPNGDWIACTSGNPNGALPGDNFGNVGPSAIVLVPSNGGSIVQLTDRTSANQSPVWAANGEQLYFVSNRRGARDVYAVEMPTHGRPLGEPVRITTGMSAHSIALSRDPERLAYVSYSARSNVWSLPISSNERTSLPASVSAAIPVTHGSQVVEMFRVSRDGRWLVYDSDREGNADIYRLRLADGFIERLTSNSADEFGGDLTADGRELAYFSWHTGSRDIFVKRLDSGQIVQITNTPWQEAGLAWSPNGRAIAFADIAVESGVRRGVFVVRRDDAGTWGAPVQRVRDAVAPNWSPDGAVLAYTRSGRVEIIPADSGEPHAVLDATWASSQTIGGPALFSDDGKRIYFKTREPDGQASIWSVSSSGGAPQLVVRLHGVSSTRQQLAVGAGRVFFTVDDRQSDIWVADLNRSLRR